MARLMLVDDEPNVLSALKRALATRGPYDTRPTEYIVETFGTAEAALDRLRQQPFDLVMSDYRMPDMDGVAFLSECRYIAPDMPRIILSGYADLEGLVKAINEARIWRFLSKPWHDYELKSTISEALAYRSLQEENQRLADEVRREREQRLKHEEAWRRLEREQPGITRGHWADGIPDDKAGGR